MTPMNLICVPLSVFTHIKCEYMFTTYVHCYERIVQKLFLYGCLHTDRGSRSTITRHKWQRLIAFVEFSEDFREIL